MSGGTARIVVRCSPELQVRFRRAAADFKDYADLLLRLLEVYEANPELFGSKARGMRYA